MKILFVCTVNKCRSPTAEWLYAKNQEHEVDSAGVDKDANTVVDQEVLLWADWIFVFERMHRNKIRKIAPSIYGKLKIECLYIPDEYEFMNGVLITMLANKLTPYLGPPARTGNSIDLEDRI